MAALFPGGPGVKNANRVCTIATPLNTRMARAGVAYFGLIFANQFGRSWNWLIE